MQLLLTHHKKTRPEKVRNSDCDLIIVAMYVIFGCFFLYGVITSPPKVWIIINRICIHSHDYILYCIAIENQLEITTRVCRCPICFCSTRGMCAFFVWCINLEISSRLIYIGLCWYSRKKSEYNTIRKYIS